jgi:glycosyltransferase involved in cell wall biosynthesis
MIGMRITLVISTLAGGGAERVATNMANHWAEKGWDVTILTTAFGRQSPCYDLHPRVTHLDLSSPRFETSPDQLHALVRFDAVMHDCSPPERAVLAPDAAHLLRMRRALASTAPDAAISYGDPANIHVLVATRWSGVPVIVSEHCDPYHNHQGDGWELLRRRLYPEAAFVTVLTDDALGYFSSFANVRGRTIPNAVTPAVVSHSGEAKPQKRGKTLLAMGRLGHEKGFDVLLKAFALVATSHRDWMLEIVGEGAVRAYLQSCIQERGLEERVLMPGFTHRPFDAMHRADLFVVSSLEEGFSNVLLEAMACGLPVVSFDCPSGPRHIIRNGVDGFLVPPRDAQALAAALDHLMGDEPERGRLAARAPEVVERFGVAKVMHLWEELLVECVRPRQRCGLQNTSA